MNLLLRESQPADLAFLREMLYDAVFWRASDDKPSFDEGLALPEVCKALADWGERDGDVAVVATVDSTPVGAAWLRFWSDDNVIRGYVEEDTPVLVIGVHRDYRHRGIGTKMIDWLFEYASMHDIGEISLMVSADNYALNLYRQQGFQEVADTGDSFLMVRKILPATIPSLLPRGDGYQFLLYGDSCSGVPGALHERTFAATNAVVSRLTPQPEFIIFPGDEIIGLTTDEVELRSQWRHWLDVEMAWLDRETIPLYHATGNHTTYGTTSERVFTEMLPHLPRNGPADQKGRSYFIRRDDLLMVFVNTLWSGLGGEGHVETVWLNETLRDHADARYKLVVGHHPVFPVNGFSGEYQREIGPEYAGPFWAILVEHGVLAYLCSHILAFDVQVHQGVLQILTAGAGTAHRMPEESEYLHCVQAALDEQGLRYQVLDHDGLVRERLSWPLRLPPSSTWTPLPTGEMAASFQGAFGDGQDGAPVVAWRFSGHTAGQSEAQPQTMLATWAGDAALPSLWLGLTGPSQRVTAIVGSQPGRSPHYWFGPSLGADSDFDVQIAIHAGMGPGGFLWRQDDESPWSSMPSSSSWGPERMFWPERWSIGFSKGGTLESPFLGANLAVSWYACCDGYEMSAK